jgi:hypothetical protein
MPDAQEQTIELVVCWELNRYGSFAPPLITFVGAVDPSAMGQSIGVAVNKMVAENQFDQFCDSTDLALKQKGIDSEVPRQEVQTGALATVGALVGAIWDGLPD